MVRHSTTADGLRHILAPRSFLAFDISASLAWLGEAAPHK